MRSRIARFATYALGITVLGLASAQSALAGTPTITPEIDGNTISAGLGLLAAGALIIRARRK